MPDREKVIKGLEELEGFFFKEYTNTKAEESKIYYDRFKSLSDALELLKEQETKEVKELTNMYTGLPITHCPKCGISIDRYLYGRQHEGEINYCPHCGRAVKWE